LPFISLIQAILFRDAIAVLRTLMQVDFVLLLIILDRDRDGILAVSHAQPVMSFL
jgi:hypothetical protein